MLLLLQVGVDAHAVDVDAVDVFVLARTKTLDVHSVAVQFFVPFDGGRQFSDEDNGIATLEGWHLADWVS